MPRQRWERPLLVAILLLAAALRLGAPGITEFKRDEANLSQLALDLAQGRDLPLLGIASSVGVPNPPINVYLMAIPYTLGSSPIPATLFVGALNVIAVALTWRLARRYYGPVVAVLAALLYAVGPWAVIYSRKIWAQDLLPPFVVAVVFTGLLAFGERRTWAHWLHWPLLALAVQIHYGAFVLVPLSVIMLALWARRLPWRHTAIGLLLAALTLVPALVGAWRADLLTLDTLRTGLDSGGERTRAISTTALDHARLTIAGTEIHALAGPQQFERYLDTVPDVYPLLDLIPVGVAAAAVWLAGRALRRGRARTSPDLVLVAWLIVPVLAYTWEWVEVAPHYMIPLMPAAYLALGAGGAALWARSGRGLRAVGAAGLIVIAGLQVGLVVQLLRFVDAHATPGGFGTPLHYLLEARAALLARDPADVIVVSVGEVAPVDEVPAVWGVLLDPLPSVRFANGTQTAVIPAGDALLLIAPVPDLRLCTGSDCQAGALDVFALRPGEAPLVLREAVPGAWADVSAIEPVRFANDAHLTGYAVRADGVLLRWELGGPVAVTPQVTVHALDAGGQRLAQHDRFSWAGQYWRAGDTLYLWVDLVLPPEAVTLRVGMYTLADGEPDTVEVLDAQGAYLAQGWDIPLDG